MEIREKAISILHSFFLDGVIPSNTVSDEEVEESEASEEEEQSPSKHEKLAIVESTSRQQGESTLTSTEIVRREASELKESLSPGQQHVSQNTAVKPEGRRSRSGKKAKKRHSQQKYMQKTDGSSGLNEESTSRRDDIAMSDTEEVLSSSSRCASPEDSRSRKTPLEVMQESSPNQLVMSSKKFIGKSSELLKDGYVVALYAKDLSGLHVSRQRTKNGGWFLDTLSNVSKRDPAAQFIIAYRNKVNLFLSLTFHLSCLQCQIDHYKLVLVHELVFQDTVGLRSFAAGGKLLQVALTLESVTSIGNSMLLLWNLKVVVSWVCVCADQ